MKAAKQIFSSNFVTAFLNFRHCSENRGARMNKTWALNWLVKLLFLLVQMLEVNFSLENSCENLGVKPIFSCNLRKHQRWVLWAFTLSSSLDGLTVLKANRRNSNRQSVSWDFHL